MAYFLSPLGNSQFIDANGDPLVGGKIYTYLAGSTTPTATYTSNTGATPQANPIILNSLGVPASPIWLAEGISYKFVVKDAADVTLPGLGGDNIEGVNDAATSASEWVASGYVPTYLSATSFSVPGDQTDTLSVGRRLQTRNTSGLVYSRISASVFGAVTTVTVVNDGATLDAGLSTVAYGLASSTNPSLPDSDTVRAAMGISTGYVGTLGAPGSVKFPNWLGGWVIKWGSVVTSAVADVTVTFATAFPTAIYAAYLTPVNAAGSGNVVASLGAIVTTSIAVGAYAGDTGARSTSSVYWLAIGK